MNQRKHVGTILVLYPIFLFTSSWCGAAAQLRPVPMGFKVNTEIWIRFIGLRFTLKHREHRKCRKYKLSFVFLRFSYLSILNEPFRRGNAQIIHKIWACMGPLQNTKPSITNIQHHLYKIEVHPIYPHQNMTQKCKTWPLQNHLLANWGIAKWIFNLFDDAQSCIL